MVLPFIVMKRSDHCVWEVEPRPLVCAVYEKAVAEKEDIIIAQAQPAWACRLGLTLCPFHSSLCWVDWWMDPVPIVPPCAQIVYSQAPLFQAPSQTRQTGLAFRQVETGCYRPDLPSQWPGGSPLPPSPSCRPLCCPNPTPAGNYPLAQCPLFD